MPTLDSYDKAEGGVPPAENRLHYPALDGLRAVAVLMVFCQHYLGSYVHVCNWGWCGVDIFFVLSGFLITGILYDSRHDPDRLRNFYGRRMLRIFPLYYGVLLAAFALTPIFHWAWHPAWIMWLLYLGNYNHFIWPHVWASGTEILDNLRSTPPYHPAFLWLQHLWSLCVEEQFYLIWPAVVFFVRDRLRLRNLCLTVSVICLGLRIACVLWVPEIYLTGELLYRATPLRADALLFGGFIALALRGPEGTFVLEMGKRFFYTTAVVFSLLELLFKFREHHFYVPVHRSGNLVSTLGFTVIDLVASGLILSSLDRSSHVYRLGTLRPLQALGRISYGFYIFHDIPHSLYARIAVRLLPNFGERYFLTAAIGLVFTLILSTLSYMLYEKPFLRLKKHFVSSGTPA